MRFNEKELATLSLADAELEGRLNYRKIPCGNFSQSGTGFKERWFKLKYNLLFYFKINELGQIDEKPAGVFVLETAKVHMDLSGAQFAFSLTFRDDPDKRHIFSARTEGTVHSWVHSLQKATYESLRNQLITLQGKINSITGKRLITDANKCQLCLYFDKDPLLMYPRNKGIIRDFQQSKSYSECSSFVKTSFQSHLRFSQSSQITTSKQIVPETNLIDL